MNYKAVLSILGKTLIAIAVFMLVPVGVCLFYKEYTYISSFAVPIIIALLLGIPACAIKVRDKTIYQKEGFVVVALVWILMSLLGALPFVISKTIPNFVDAFFETVSGFSTTGASILTNVDAMLESSKAIMFWRLFTHWIGGMGVLVFILAFLPAGNSGLMHLFRAESPGPTASKFVSKMSYTARILYLIYLCLTALEIFLLLLGNMPLYDSVLYAFSTAGTGGFGITNAGITAYKSAYLEIIVAVFMMIFGINFNVFYLIIVGQGLKALKSEELRTYLIIIAVSVLVIAINILNLTQGVLESFRLAFFQVTSITSTTGLATADFVTWPALSKSILLFLTIMGACGGSTGGGFKVSRLVVLYRSSQNDLRTVAKKRLVNSVKFEGQAVGQDTERSVRLFFMVWVGLVVLSTIILSLDPITDDVFTNFSATLACVGNVGPGLTEVIGPMANYAGYSSFSKILLSFIMLAGRLEIFPMLILFSPRTWKRSK